MTAGTWSAELSRLGVVVMEARSFLNLLEEGEARLVDADLLVRGPLVLVHISKVFSLGYTNKCKGCTRQAHIRERAHQERHHIYRSASNLLALHRGSLSIILRTMLFLLCWSEPLAFWVWSLCFKLECDPSDQCSAFELWHP